MEGAREMCRYQDVGSETSKSNFLEEVVVRRELVEYKLMYGVESILEVGIVVGEDSYGRIIETV